MRKATVAPDGTQGIAASPEGKTVIVADNGSGIETLSYY
jgi:hypothetical protein